MDIEKKKILLIEDETFRNSTMVEMMNLDYDVNWAKSPKEAYDMLLTSDRIDLIVLDIMLPVDDCFTDEEKIKCNNGNDTGLVLAHKLSLEDNNKKIPIILASARNDLDKPNSKNVKSLLFKPFYYQDLKSEIEKSI